MEGGGNDDVTRKDAYHLLRLLRLQHNNNEKKKKKKKLVLLLLPPSLSPIPPPLLLRFCRVCDAIGSLEAISCLRQHNNNSPNGAQEKEKMLRVPQGTDERTDGRVGKGGKNK